MQIRSCLRSIHYKCVSSHSFSQRRNHNFLQRCCSLLLVVNCSLHKHFLFKASNQTTRSAWNSPLTLRSSDTPGFCDIALFWLTKPLAETVVTQKLLHQSQGRICSKALQKVISVSKTIILYFDTVTLPVSSTLSSFSWM